MGEALGSWSGTLGYPDAWIDVPLTPADADVVRVREAVAARVGDLLPEGAADPGEREVLVDLIAAVMADDAGRGAVLGAHRYRCEPPDDRVHAHLTVWVVERRHPDSLDAELTALTRLAERPKRAQEPPEVGRVALPHAGSGVRVRFLEAEPVMPPPEDDGLATVLIDTVTYLVPVEGSGDAVVLRFWTPHLARAGQLVAEFDAVAESLRVEPSPTEAR